MTLKRQKSSFELYEQYIRTRTEQDRTLALHSYEMDKAALTLESFDEAFEVVKKIKELEDAIRPNSQSGKD